MDFNEELIKYEDIYGELNFNTFVIIIFGFRSNIKYCKYEKTKINAFDTYFTIFKNSNFKFSNCDDRGYDIQNSGKSILNGFDNDFGLITMVGFNDAELLYFYFTKEYIIISKEKNENSKHKILEKNINKIKKFIK